MINQKGQAFDVFKLLIAAVVAIVILTILLGILKIIPPPNENIPNEAAGKLIKESNITKASIRSSQVVEFSEDNPQLFSKAIAEASQYSVSTDQICVSSGPFKGDEWVEGGKASLVTYKLSAPKKAKIEGICDKGRELPATLESLDREDMLIDGCGCLENSETCCLLVLKQV